MNAAFSEDVAIGKPVKAPELQNKYQSGPENEIQNESKYGRRSSARRRISRPYPHSLDLGMYEARNSLSGAILLSNRSETEYVMREKSTSGSALTRSSTILKEVQLDQVSMKQDPNSFFDHVRTLVSKKKRRYVDGGMDLDLTYITKNLIAMGFPSEGVEGLYRNRMRDMQKFFNTRHRNKYIIYNLCSERNYDKDKFEGRVIPFPFDDHNCPPFDDLEPLCESIDTWLSHDSANVAAMHCKAGKGRTGLVICVYLLHTGTWKDANSALNFYAFSRTTNMKGVTIPSQRRWVRYYEIMLKRRKTGEFRASKRYRIKSVFVSRSAPGFTEMVVFNQRTQTYNPNETFGMLTSLNTKEYTHPQFREGVLLKCRPDLIIHKDVKVQWNQRGRIKKGKTRVFSLWFNTDFIKDNNRLLFVKKDIDKVNKQKKVRDFIVCFEFEPLDHDQVVNKGKNCLDLSTLKNPQQLVILALMLQDGINSRNRQWKGKMYRDVFRGVDVVSWLIEEGGAKSVEDAVEIGDLLIYNGLIKAVSKEEEEIEGKFGNTGQFYRFSTESNELSSAFREEKKEDVGAVRIAANELTKPPVRTVSAANAEEL